jgi:diguanylate cyclase (GGDEF)-like protein
VRTIFGKVLLVADRRHRAFGLTSLILWFLALTFQWSAVVQTGTTISQVIMFVLITLFLVTHLRIGALMRAHERGLRSTMDFLYSTRYMNEIAGLADARTFLDDLRRSKNTARWFGTPSVVVSVRLANIDEVRDRYGDHVGSKAVRELAKTLRRITRGDDLVAYLGSGRFAIILVDCSFDQSAQFAWRVPASLAAEANGEPVTLQVEMQRFDVDTTEFDELTAAIDGSLCMPAPLRAAHRSTGTLLDAA